MTASKIFLYFCLSFIFGIFLSSFFNFSQLILLGFLISALILISVSPSLNSGKRARLVVIGFCLLFLVFGIWRYQQIEIRISKSKLQIYNNREEIIIITGIVIAEPDIREKSQKLVIKVLQINHYENTSRTRAAAKGEENFVLFFTSSKAWWVKKRIYPLRLVEVRFW